MIYVLKDSLGESCFGVVDFRGPIEEAADLRGNALVKVRAYVDMGYKGSGWGSEKWPYLK